MGEIKYNDCIRVHDYTVRKQGKNDLSCVIYVSTLFLYGESNRLRCYFVSVITDDRRLSRQYHVCIHNYRNYKLSRQILQATRVYSSRE